MPGFDEAVRVAIKKSQPYPADKSGVVPSQFTLSSRPMETQEGIAKPDAGEKYVFGMAPRELLIGKWRSVELLRVVDGTRLVPQKIDADNIADFKSDNTWSAIGPYYRSAGTYRWINDNQIDQTIIESNLAIQIGLVSIKSVDVNQQRLEFSIKQTAADLEKVLPPPRPGVLRQNTTMVITRFNRVVPPSSIQAANLQPIYPAESRRNGEEGTVILRTLLRADGTAHPIQIQQSSGHERLDKAALLAVEQWIFKPQMVDGKPMEAWPKIPISFKLDLPEM